MKARVITLLTLALLTVLLAASSVRAQGDDVYFINSGQLWRWPAGGTRDQKPPQRITLSPSLPSIGSIVVNSRSIAFMTTGLDGNIYRTDGETATRIHTHSGQVRQLAFGSSDDILFFSAVETPQSPNPPADGQIFALDLTTQRAEPRFTVQQSTVESAWLGAFTIDANRQIRVYVGTSTGAVYELRGTQPPGLFFRHPGEPVHSLMAWDGAPYLYTTGGAEVYRMRFLGERALALSQPGGRLTSISYAPFPSSQGEPCELMIQLTGAEPGLISLYSPVVRGPNLHWQSPDLAPHGGRVANGKFRYFVLRGTYWVSMDTKADSPRSPRPSKQKVECTGAGSEVSFSF
jgi:hypothetical protein